MGGLFSQNGEQVVDIEAEARRLDNLRSQHDFRYSADDLDRTSRPGKTEKVLFNIDRGTDISEWGGTQGVLEGIKSDAVKGLNDGPDGDIQVRREIYGGNGRPMRDPATYWALIFEGLQDFTIEVLIVAAVVSIILGVVIDPVEGWHDGLAILMAVLIVINVGAINDLEKDKKFRELESQNNRIEFNAIRSGNVSRILVDDVVVGDVIMLQSGDQVPADGLVLEATDFELDESAMTGEGDRKKKDPVREKFLISGSSVQKGTGRMLIVGVGTRSEIGRMAEKLKAPPPPTPLQLKLERLAQQISKFGLIAGLICFFAMFITHMSEYGAGEGTVDENGDPEWKFSNYGAIVSYFITAVTVVVVAVPEGLPLAVTIALAYSMKKMQNDNILVRHLHACETMGGATTICTDKTGTLTQNKMTVVQLWAETDGVSPAAFFSQQKTGKQDEIDEFHSNVRRLSDKAAEVLRGNSILNSTSDVVFDKKKNKEVTSGSATEIALYNLQRAMGETQYPFALREAVKPNLVKIYPFSSDRKRMSVLYQTDGGRNNRLYVKGASEMILRLCTSCLNVNGQVVSLTGEMDIHSDGSVTGSGRKKMVAQDVIAAMADKALRTIAIAYRDLGPNVDGMKDREIEYDEGEQKGRGPCPAVENDLTLVCIVGLQDPVRPEVPDAVFKCQQAGIVVRMVTGDNIVTAKAIAAQCHILTEGGVAIEGPDFRVKVKTDDTYFPSEGRKICVMARSAPEDKYVMVTKLMERDDVVAVTGDGTNDAPALKNANVGFAMGIAGTEVAKQAAAIILLDDNFASIVKAIAWGRNVNDSIRKFLQFQLTVNLVAVIVASLGALSLKESPLSPTQLLWVNLIMDSFASLALATDEPSPDVLKRQPYKKKESLVSKHMLRSIIAQFSYQMIIMIVLIYTGETIFGVPIGRGMGQYVPASKQYTIVFHAFVIMQLFNEVCSRKIYGEYNIFDGILKNWIFIGVFFGTIIVQFLIVEFAGEPIQVTPLNAEQHGICIIIGMAGLVVSYLSKVVPVDWFPNLGEEKSLTDSERRMWSSLTRRNSSEFVMSAAGSTGSKRSKDPHANPVAGGAEEVEPSGALVEMKTKTGASAL